MKVPAAVDVHQTLCFKPVVQQQVLEIRQQLHTELNAPTSSEVHVSTHSIKKAGGKDRHVRHVESHKQCTCPYQLLRCQELSSASRWREQPQSTRQVQQYRFTQASCVHQKQSNRCNANPLEYGRSLGQSSSQRQGGTSTAGTGAATCFDCASAAPPAGPGLY